MRLTKADGEVVTRLQETLTKLGLSASELGRRCGWSQPYIARRMTGRTPWLVRDLALIAEVLGVPIGALIHERESHGS
jgi:transcriptional regulator with XRE-family HTH domain